MKHSIIEFLHSFLTATSAFFAQRKSKQLSDKWMQKELHKYESADRKAGGLY
jgi:hypothetical protein